MLFCDIWLLIAIKRFGLWRKLSAEALCFWTVVLEQTLERPLDCKEIQPVHSKGCWSPWVFFGRTNAKAETLATSCEELTHWKRLWCWEGLWARGEGDDRGWDGWMVTPTRWMWVWVNSGSWWWTGRPGVLRCMGSQRVEHDWATELNWRGIPGGSDSKESTCNAGDKGAILGLGRSSGEGKGCPLQYSFLEISTDCIVYVITKGRTWLNDFHFLSLSHIGRVWLLNLELETLNLARGWLFREMENIFKYLKISVSIGINRKWIWF